MLNLICICLVSLANCVIVIAANSIDEPNLLAPEWNHFKKIYRKQYRDEIDEKLRFKIWKNNLDFINFQNEKAQKGNSTYKCDINQFGDMTPKEYSKFISGFDDKLQFQDPKSKKIRLYSTRKGSKLPKSLDWRNSGRITPVKNQGQCGACWAFSATGSIESQVFNKTGKLISLSEQNLMDCSESYGNSGCNGGFMENAFDYIIQNGGINTEKSYPYSARLGRCSFKKDDPHKVTIQSYVKIPEGDELALQEVLVDIGPVAIAIDASLQSFQFYSSGVFHDADCKNSLSSMTHAMLIVGYDTGDKEDYWIVKNSWGRTWGENGYMKVARNKKNHCGIATASSVPIL